MMKISSTFTEVNDTHTNAPHMHIQLIYMGQKEFYSNTQMCELPLTTNANSPNMYKQPQVDFITWEVEFYFNT